MDQSHGGRILVLGGIRGFGMCMVLVQHYFYTREAEGGLNTFDRTVFGLVDSGWWAIDLFFVLSAFLITGILCDTRENRLSGRTVFYAFNGWRGEDLGQRANDAIQWRAIHDACREGFRRYDLGEVEEHNRGLAAFKTKWGGRPSRLYRYYYPAPGRLEARTLTSTPARARAFRAAWRWLPLGVTAVVGHRLYRGL